jgi:hypothetical protein
MADRVGDPWAERDADRWAPSASLLHSHGDAMDIAVKDGRIAGVRGRAHDRVDRGRLDPKDVFGLAGQPPPRGDASDRLHSKFFRGPRSGGLGLLRDRELLAVVARCEGETAIQLKWLRTQTKETAPQALVVAR